jgi:hypothetical protein
LDAHAQAVKTFGGTSSARPGFDQIQRLSREGSVDSDFLAELSRQLHKIVPFDASFWAGIDPVTMLAISPSRIENVYHHGGCHQYWTNELLVPDVNQFRTLARAANPAASLYRATGGDPARSFRYRDLNQPLGLVQSGRGAAT